MPSLVLRTSQESTADAIIKRLRRFQKTHGDGKLVPRTAKQLHAAACEGLILYCENGRGWMGACGVMLEHVSAESRRKRAPLPLFFVEAGGGAVRMDYRRGQIASLLLHLGTLAALAKNGESRRCFAVSAHAGPDLFGLYRRMPEKAAAAAIAAAGYPPAFGIRIGETHHYFELDPDDAWNAELSGFAALQTAAIGLVERLEAGVVCPKSNSVVTVNFDPVRRLFPRWGVPV